MADTKLLDDVLNGTKLCLHCECEGCSYHNNGCTNHLMKDSVVLIEKLVEDIEKMKDKCREMNREIRELKAKNITASGNGIAVGEIRGGLVIQRQEAKEIHNISHVEVFNE